MLNIYIIITGKKKKEFLRIPVFVFRGKYLLQLSTDHHRFHLMSKMQPLAYTITTRTAAGEQHGETLYDYMKCI